jgi:predicted double-glycine peptidase
MKNLIPSISFKHNIPIEQTMMFEEVFEQELRLTPKDKYGIISNGNATWLFVGNEIAGEIYSIEVKRMFEIEDSLDDLDDKRYFNEKTSYIYSCAILPKFQGKGYGRLLYAYHLGYIESLGYTLVTGHSTSPEMDKLNTYFKASFSSDKIHEKWYGTQRVAKFYEIRLININQYKQDDDDSCGVFALKYLFDKYTRYNYSIYTLRKVLKPKYHKGIGTEKIKRFLNTEQIDFKENNQKKFNTPLFIRYTEEDNIEHYSVIIDQSKNNYFIFDPWLGEVRKINKDKFHTMWYSNKCGEYWGLNIYDKEDCNAK